MTAHLAEHSLSAEPTHSRWNRALPPRLTIAPGDTVHFECVDASGAQVRPGMTVEEYVKIDRGKIHALTGPVAVRGAEPGDVLQIDVLEVTHKGWGRSSVIGGLGFLKERFTEPFLFHWKLDGGVSRSLEPAVVQLRPFLRLSQVVNEPVTTVSASIAKRILPSRKLFSPQAIFVRTFPSSCITSIHEN